MESDTNKPKECTWCGRELSDSELARDVKRVAINLEPLNVCNPCDRELHQNFE